MKSAIHDRIAKLIAHEVSARKIGSLSEAEAFASKIQNMLLTHKLSLSDIELDAEEHNEPITEEVVRPEDTDHFYKAKSQVKMSPLADVIARAFFCRVLLGGKSIWFVGRESNRRAAVDLYKLLVNIAASAYKDELKVYRKSYEYTLARGSKTAKDIAFKNGYFIGFTRTIQLRFNQQQKTSLHATIGAGLVLVNRMNKDVEDHMLAMRTRTVKARGINYSNAGIQAGDRRAKDVSLISKALL